MYMAFRVDIHTFLAAHFYTFFCYLLHLHIINTVKSQRDKERVCIKAILHCSSIPVFRIQFLSAESQLSVMHSKES